MHRPTSLYTIIVQCVNFCIQMLDFTRQITANSTKIGLIRVRRQASSLFQEITSRGAPCLDHSGKFQDLQPNHVRTKYSKNSWNCEDARLLRRTTKTLVFSNAPFRITHNSKNYWNSWLHFGTGFGIGAACRNFGRIASRTLSFETKYISKLAESNSSTVLWHV